MKVKASELSRLKMSVKIPKCVEDADCCVIHNGKVKQYVGIGWLELRTATEEDYKSIPQVEE